MTTEDYGDGEQPEVIKVNLKRLSPREISTIEEHTGFTARRWEDKDCPVGKLSEAMAYVMLRRRYPDMERRKLWEKASDTVVETEDSDVPPTSESN